ncbi:MAG: TetR/AcrR family transcriptional regulator [Bacteroidaceae bacterium]|nr:TetR/AcrR family transcriptional regulator [Bacteroidaceae bacterium]
MAVSKTRELLVDVARQLFAKNGFENTSMNDIAVIANKGRRTLYTYFNSKDEIYLAVIQSELERLYGRMEEVARKNISPEEKMVQLIFSHLEICKEAVYRNGNLRAEFFRDIWKVEAVRKTFDKNEINLFRRVMNEGVDKGIFDIRNVRLMAEIAHYCLKGCEVPYIYGRYAVQNPEELCPYVRRMVMRQLGKNSSYNSI